MAYRHPLFSIALQGVEIDRLKSLIDDICKPLVSELRDGKTYAQAAAELKAERDRLRARLAEAMTVVEAVRDFQSVNPIFTDSEVQLSTLRTIPLPPKVQS